MIKFNKKLSSPLAIGIIIILALAVIVICFYLYKTMPAVLQQDEIKNQVTPKKESDKIEKNIDLLISTESEIMSCKIDKDCGIQFDTCACKTVCRNSKDYKYIDNCQKSCKIEDTDFSIQDCKCENNKCVKKAVQYFAPGE